tara:strand:+ start:629 stop:763 length:135 start_codon:yes stop_codon:yes gene_type:complete
MEIKKPNNMPGYSKSKTMITLYGLSTKLIGLDMKGKLALMPNCA